MKLCGDDKVCPYQSKFDVLWELEATDPGLCEIYMSEPNSKCLLKKDRDTVEKEGEPGHTRHQKK